MTQLANDTAQMARWRLKRIRQQDVYLSPEGELYRRARSRERPDRLIEHDMVGLAPMPVRRLSARECAEVLQPLEGFD